MAQPYGAASRVDSLDDVELARRCAIRDRSAIEQVISANNQRMFRAAWSILGNRAEAEEAVQSAYLSAFASIGSFEGRSALSTWLTRIVINEALGRRRAEQRRRHNLEQEGVAVLDAYRAREPRVLLHALCRRVPAVAPGFYRGVAGT